MSAVSQPAETPHPAQTPAPIVTLEGVTKRYRNGVVALDHLSLTLREGEVVALLGPNGAGKSTALKLMMGLSTPSSGAVRLFGQDPRFAANRLRLGVMLQVGRAPETLKVSEHLELFRGYYPHPLATADLIRLAGLEGLANRLFGQLSGGQKQRVLFALALAGDPDLVFLDEPTVGLDIEARRGLWAAIRELAARGKTVLLTTHYLEEADALASRIVVIARGRVVCEGSPAEIKALGAQKRAGNPATVSLPGFEAASSTPVKVITCLTGLDGPKLAALPGIVDVQLVAGHATLASTHPENTLRALLAQDATLRDVAIASPALEDAFLALTAA